jgi:plasmid stabilization system protein ParE
MDVIFDPAADAEIDEAVDYYRGIDEALAQAFLLELENAAERVADHPHVWQCILRHFRRFNLRRFPYALIYSLEPDHVYVLAVMHERRRPNYWLERAPDR